MKAGWCSLCSGDYHLWNQGILQECHPEFLNNPGNAVQGVLNPEVKLQTETYSIDGILGI